MKGLSAMPSMVSFASGWHCRPLLDYPLKKLEDYATQRQLTWIDDESNFDTGFDRNYLRHNIMPLLRQRWPAMTKTIARSANHCAAAASLIEMQAQEDWQKITVKNLIDLSQLYSLPKTRQAEVIRYGLHHLQLPLCSQNKLNEILVMMSTAGRGTNPIIKWPGAEARRYRQYLYLMKPLKSINQKPMVIHVGEDLELPDQQGRLVWQQVSGGLNMKSGQALRIQYRQGSERFHPQGRQGSHPIKKLMQEWNILPWIRDKVPLLYQEEELIAVVGYAIADDYALDSAQQGWLLKLICYGYR